MFRETMITSLKNLPLVEYSAELSNLGGFFPRFLSSAGSQSKSLVVHSSKSSRWFTKDINAYSVRAPLFLK